MKKTYSLYEAKAKFSEIIRQVRERGMPVTVTYHGQPVAEIRPVEVPESADPFEKRRKEMIARGELIPGDGRRLELRTLKKVPGGLQRFLEERD